MNVDKKVGFNKSKLRCFNSHDEGHFARECTKPRVEHNPERVVVPSRNNRDAAPEMMKGL